VVGLSAAQPEEQARTTDGARPVNLRTDLGPLADLIEIAFSSSMDSSGRAAVREMRALSRMGAGLNLLGNLNDLAQGMGTGYVYIADGRLIGNVSTYPAESSGPLKDDWVIVNVATHPDYRGRGIAHRLMQDTLQMIRKHGGRNALLQVDADNPTARRLYQRLGFYEERGWTTWRRNAAHARVPELELPPPHIVHPQAGEWRAEYALAAHVRPQAMGGLGWLRPLTEARFNRSIWRRLTDWFSLRGLEKLCIRSATEADILASLWIESGFTLSATKLTLLVHPDYEGYYDEALINTAVNRFGGGAISIEHPADRATTSAILRRYGFSTRRDVVHMRVPLR
jgi:ribosomal protein S18 acetylase RimI-like enzyme